MQDVHLHVAQRFPFEPSPFADIPESGLLQRSGPQLEILHQHLRKLQNWTVRIHNPYREEVEAWHGKVVGELARMPDPKSGLGHRTL